MNGNRFALLGPAVLVARAKKGKVYLNLIDRNCVTLTIHRSLDEAARHAIQEGYGRPNRWHTISPRTKKGFLMLALAKTGAGLLTERIRRRPYSSSMRWAQAFTET